MKKKKRNNSAKKAQETSPITDTPVQENEEKKDFPIPPGFRWVGLLLIADAFIFDANRLGALLAPDGVISIVWKRGLIGIAQAVLLIAGACLLFQSNIPGELLKLMKKQLLVILGVSAGVIALLGWGLTYFALCGMLPFLLLLLLFDAFLIGRYHWTTPSGIRKCAKHAVAFCASALLCLTLLETYAYLHVESDGFGVSLRGQKWMNTYWNPLTPEGFRDITHSPEVLQNKKAVFVVGDSFAGGHGINDIRDRFAEKMQQQLGDTYETCVLAKCGLDTRDETQAVKSYLPEVKPQTVILGYFLNDIDKAAAETGHFYGVKQAPEWLRPVLSNSYFADMLWYRLFHSLVVVQSSYLEFLKELYADHAAWKIHQSDLHDFVQACKQRGTEDVRIIAVIFPMLNAIEQTAPITATVAETLQNEGIETIDLAPVLKGRPASELVVSPYDAHPSKELHAEVGKMLAERIQQPVKPAINESEETK